MTERFVRLTSVVSFALIGLVVTGVGAAQQATEPRLDPAVRAALDKTVAAAGSQGLPTEPLVDKALEGTAKHAEPERIIAAVHRLAAGLSSAREQLGPETNAADLVAGAEVLRAGVEPAALARLRRSRPKESVLVPLVILADLVSRGVSPGAATDAVLSLADRGASDAEFNTMQQAVRRGIEAKEPNRPVDGRPTPPDAKGKPGKPGAGPARPPAQPPGQKPDGRPQPPKGKPPKGDHPHPG